MNDSITFIRLVTGEAVIAKLIGDSKGVVAVLENPAQITMQQVSENPNDIKLALVDFLPFAEKDKKMVEVAYSHILYMHEPTAALRNAYSKMFGSGLIIPQMPTPTRLHLV